MNRILLADAMSRSPNSTQFRDLITASGKYGFTRGSYAADVIELTDLGEQLTKPRSQEEHLEALRAGMKNIPLLNQILNLYENNKLPTPEFLRNARERDPFDVKAEWSQEAAEIFVANGRHVGFIRTIGGSFYVILESGAPIEEAPPRETMNVDPALDAYVVAVAPTPSAEISTDSDQQRAPTEASVPQPFAFPDAPPATVEQVRFENRQFFIAHGWDKDALGQVQAILNRLQIPYVVAQDKANAARPISKKIRDMMKSCSAGIFICSADEEFKDKDGNTIWRPRENVIYELGAASLEYGQRIVIVKEKCVYFPRDFRDLGYIEYEKGSLDAKAMNLLMELIVVGAVKITAGA
jgi:hypothetical protein